MEIIGTYKVRNIKEERLIKAPEKSWGEYVLKVHPDGSFSYHPNEGQKNPLGTRYVVKDPSNIILPISFKDESKAFEWKQKMELEHGRLFRMEKIFGSSSDTIKVLGPYS